MNTATASPAGDAIADAERLLDNLDAAHLLAAAGDLNRLPFTSRRRPDGRYTVYASGAPAFTVDDAATADAAIADIGRRYALAYRDDAGWRVTVRDRDREPTRAATFTSESDAHRWILADYLDPTARRCPSRVGDVADTGREVLVDLPGGRRWRMSYAAALRLSAALAGVLAARVEDGRPVLLAPLD